MTSSVRGHNSSVKIWGELENQISAETGTLYPDYLVVWLNHPSSRNSLAVGMRLEN
jgi:hypothetical protein